MKTLIRDVRSRSDGQHNTWEQFANHRLPAPTSRWSFAIKTPLPLCSLVCYHARLAAPPLLFRLCLPRSSASPRLSMVFISLHGAHVEGPPHFVTLDKPTEQCAASRGTTRLPSVFFRYQEPTGWPQSKRKQKTGGRDGINTCTHPNSILDHVGWIGLDPRIPSAEVNSGPDPHDS
jgi:hypothetical protein